MVSNITYKLSVFSDYLRFSYNKDDLISILGAFDEVPLAPAVFQEWLPNGTVSQRMQFSANNGLLLITVLTERIDIQITSNRKDGFTEPELNNVKTKLLDYMNIMLEIASNKAEKPYRLAWFTTYVYFEQSEQAKKDYRNKFLKTLDFFETNPLNDMVVRYGAQRCVKIGDVEETLNVLLTINRHFMELGPEMRVDGYKADYDINTWQENSKNRFDVSDVKSFVEKAYSLQLELDKEVLP